MTKLPRRIATAVVTIPLLVLLILRGSPDLVEAVTGVCLLIGLAEAYILLAAGGVAAFRVTGVLLLVAVFLHVARGPDLGGALWPAAAMAVAVAGLGRSRRDLTGAVAASAATLLAAVYLGALGGTIAALVRLDPLEHGPQRMLMLLATVMVADALAFFGGTAFGRRKLAPRLSPKKTVEGAVCAVIGGILGAAGLRLVAALPLSWAHTVALGALVAAAAILGDLAESAFKRWAGVKDSGSLFPGHGGMLDRLDSLLFGAPVLYYYFLYAAH